MNPLKRILQPLIFAVLIFTAFEASAQNSPRKFREALVLRSMSAIHGAQATYQATAGNGNFGSLQNLVQAQLINPALARGNIYGYTYVLSVIPYTQQPPSPGRFTLTVTPNHYRKTGLRSFYIDEWGEIYGGDVGGRPATANDPYIDDCTTGGIVDNERCIINDLRILHGAQATYQASTGNGNFGTIPQLHAMGLIGRNLSDGSAHGYTISVQTINVSPPQTPASFRIWATPQTYGVTGVRSFYIATDGVLRGADRQGQPASENDPPIGN